MNKIKLVSAAQRNAKNTGQKTLISVSLHKDCVVIQEPFYLIYVCCYTLTYYNSPNIKTKTNNLFNTIVCMTTTQSNYYKWGNAKSHSYSYGVCQDSKNLNIFSQSFKHKN